MGIDQALPRWWRLAELLSARWMRPSFQKPREPKEVLAIVMAIARWSKDKSEGQFPDRLNNDDGEVVIPEIVMGTGQ